MLFRSVARSLPRLWVVDAICAGAPSMPPATEIPVTATATEVITTPVRNALVGTLRRVDSVVCRCLGTYFLCFDKGSWLG